jgi:hypothetical protein
MGPVEEVSVGKTDWGANLTEPGTGNPIVNKKK